MTRVSPEPTLVPPASNFSAPELFLMPTESTLVPPQVPPLQRMPRVKKESNQDLARHYTNPEEPPKQSQEPHEARRQKGCPNFPRMLRHPKKRPKPTAKNGHRCPNFPNAPRLPETSQVTPRICQESSWKSAHECTNFSGKPRPPKTWPKPAETNCVSKFFGQAKRHRNSTRLKRTKNQRNSQEPP